MRPHSKIAIPLVAVGALLVAAIASTGCSRFTLHNPLSGVIEPSITPSPSQRGSQVVDRDFNFEDVRVKLTVPVNRAVYSGSSSAQKSAIFIGGANPANWVGDYYRAFISEKHQEVFYTSLLEALHSARQKEHLDSSRYVELVTSMVQEMEYRIDPGSLAPKFPIETFGDGYGDCDDKTLLAAALLSRDGYDVAILLFSPEEHVALGIRAPGLDYKHTGYAYVEMTEPSLVGVPAEKLAGNVRLKSQPDVIRIGKGAGAFAAVDQIEYIQRSLREIRADEMRLSGQIDASKAELTRRKTALEAAKQTEQNSSGNLAALTAAVQEYNSQVGQYNHRVAQLTAVIDRYNSLVAAERFVVGHQTARPQVYQRLRDLGL